MPGQDGGVVADARQLGVVHHLHKLLVLSAQEVLTHFIQYS